MNIAPLDACPVDNVGKIPLAAPTPNPLYQVSSSATQKQFTTTSREPPVFLVRNIRISF